MTTPQQLISAHVLSMIRAGEQRLGLASVAHYYQRSTPSNKGTPSKKHANNRGELKRRRRAFTVAAIAGDVPYAEVAQAYYAANAQA